MKETDWQMLRAYLEHSGLSQDEIVKACGKYQAEKHFQAELPLADVPSTNEPSLFDAQNSAH